MIVEPATGLGDLAGAGESWRVVHGPDSLTGLMHLPPTPPPTGGWPVVTYGHMTTGAGARSAPSLAASEHPETRRMTQGDVLCSLLLGSGIAVLRPDYPGLGSLGPHPYLIGEPLGRSVVSLLEAARRFEPRLGSAWVSMGHSEGAMAAMYAATLGPPEGVRLLGVGLFTPVTRMDLTIRAVARLPVKLPGGAVVSPLIALMVMGAMTSSPALATLTFEGGLSDEAIALWPHLTTRSLDELALPDSFGALAPARLWGSRGAEARRLLYSSFREQDLRHLRLPRDLRLRVDAGLFDEDAPYPLTRGLVRHWRRSGMSVDLHSWRASHSGVLDRPYAPASAAAWCVRWSSSTTPGG